MQNFAPRANGAHLIAAAANLIIVSSILIAIRGLLAALLIFCLCVFCACASRLSPQQWRIILISSTSLWFFLFVSYFFFGSTNSAAALIHWPWGSTFGVELFPRMLVVWLRMVGMLILSLATVSLFGVSGLVWMLDRRRVPRAPMIPIEILTLRFARLAADYGTVKEAYRASGHVLQQALSLADHKRIFGTFVLASLASVRETAIGFVSRSLHRQRTASIYLTRTNWLLSIFFLTSACIAVLIRSYL